MAPQQATSPPPEKTAIATSSTGNNTGGPSTPSPITSDKKKRKAAHEYSTNPNTVRVRERNASLTPYQLAVERAKSNDMKAVASAWKDRISTESFQASPGEARRQILEDVEKAIMDRRRRKKIDASSKIFALNRQLKPNDDESAVAPRSGLVDNGAAARPQPPMAPPGYIAFPTQPIQDLMDNPKKKSASDAVAASALASSSSAPAPVEDSVVVQLDTESPIALATAHSNEELKTAIEELKAEYDAEKLRHETDSIRQVAETQELRGIVESLKVQMQHMAVRLQSIQATRVPTRGVPTYTHNTPHAMTPHYTPSAFQPAQPYGYRFQNKAVSGNGNGGAYGGGGDDGYNGNDGYATDDGRDGIPARGGYATGSGYVAENSEAWRG